MPDIWQVAALPLPGMNHEKLTFYYSRIWRCLANVCGEVVSEILAQIAILNALRDFLAARNDQCSKWSFAANPNYS